MLRLLAFLLLCITGNAFALIEVKAPSSYGHSAFGGEAQYPSADWSNFCSFVSGNSAYGPHCPGNIKNKDETSSQAWAATMCQAAGGSGGGCTGLQITKKCASGYSTNIPNGQTGTATFYECYKVVSTCPAGTIEKNGVCKPCPSGSTLQGSQCVCTPPLRMNAESTACYTPSCIEGTPQGNYPLWIPTGNTTEQNRQNLNSACDMGCKMKPAPGTQMGSGQCVTVGNVVSCPIIGMVRTGEVCSAPADNIAQPTGTPTNQPTPSNECAQGEQAYKVNGVTKCYTPSGASIPTSADNAKITTTNTTTVNPDGSKTVTTTTTNSATGQTSITKTTYLPSSTVPDTLPTTTSSPVVPGMGTGGTGGAGGLPGGSPTGTPNGTGNNDAHCGATGQPPCKIDETGTPTDAALTAQKEAFDQAAETRVNSINDISGSKKVSELPWTWSPQFPTGSCEALDMTLQNGVGATLDLCSNPWIHTMRSILAWIYSMLFAIYAWHRFTESVGK